METLLFEIFNSVAQTKSFTKTAEVFNISQPAVTHNIKKLESLVGLNLITRSNRGITFTDAGKEYLVFVRQILSTLSNANLRMKNIADGEYGRIRFACVPTAMNFLQEDLSKIRERPCFSNFQFDLEVLEGPDLVSTFMEDSYDFYYTTKDQIVERDEYDYITVGKGSLCFFMNKETHKNFKSANQESISNLHFVSLPLYDAQLANPVIRIMNSNHLPFKFTTFYKRTESVLLAISSGLAVSIMPESIKDYYNFENIVSVPMEGGQNCLEYVFAYSKHNRSTACDNFVKAISTLHSDLNLS